MERCKYCFANLFSSSYIISKNVCYRFWNPLLKDKRTSAFKEISYQAIWSKFNAQFISSNSIWLYLFQMEQELGLLFQNETIDPKLNVQVLTSHQGVWQAIDYFRVQIFIWFFVFWKLHDFLFEARVVAWLVVNLTLQYEAAEHRPLWSSFLAQVDSFSLVRGVVGAKVWLLLEEIHPADNGQRLEKAIRWCRHSATYLLFTLSLDNYWLNIKIGRGKEFGVSPSGVSPRTTTTLMRCQSK